MRIAAIGHSLVHMRQWIFFRHLASMGNQVLVACPHRWRHLGVESHVTGNLTVRALETTGDGDIYHFEMANARHEVGNFLPDWLYVQQEAQSDLAEEVTRWDDIRCRRAIFVWENITHPGEREQKVLGSYDLVVCGNLEAYELAKPYAKRAVILPQVGVCPDLFRPMVNVGKRIEVAFLGRPMPEKGISYLQQAWPHAQIMPWANYDELTQHYCEARLVVAYSHDMEHWKEQAMPYVAAEALMCGTQVICSDTAASVWWLHGCPAVRFVPQRSPDRLREAIADVLKHPDNGHLGRQWVLPRLSNQIVAVKLVEAFLTTDSANA